MNSAPFIAFEALVVVWCVTVWWILRPVARILKEKEALRKRWEAPRSRVFLRTRWAWLAWYPARGRRCSLELERTHCGPHLTIALGPAYLGIGPGVPTP